MPTAEICIQRNNKNGLAAGEMWKKSNIHYKAPKQARKINCDQIERNEL